MSGAEPLFVSFNRIEGRRLLDIADAFLAEHARCICDPGQGKDLADAYLAMAQAYATVAVAHFAAASGSPKGGS